MYGNYNNGCGNKCPICGKEEIDIHCNDINDKYLLYRCPDCGSFFAPDIDYDDSVKNPVIYSKFNYNREHLKSFLFYHKSENRPFLIPQKDYDEYDKSGYVKIYNLTSKMVENWYPKTFAEKIDKLLLNLYKQTAFEGDYIDYLFLANSIFYSDSSSETIRNDCEKDVQYDYVVDYLKRSNLIIVQGGLIQLTPQALERIYELQKHQVNNRNVFVAMKFGEETQALREKIKEGLEGYNIRIMDEIEHNRQIVPEMLYEIRNSKFVIAELSNHNNGAYYEAGYALGLGKEVIHICQKSELTNGLHFDVAQVNTIVYENIYELPEKLKKRIQATIK